MSLENWNSIFMILFFWMYFNLHISGTSFYKKIFAILVRLKNGCGTVSKQKRIFAQNFRKIVG